MAIVYQHRRKDNNEIFYVGIGKYESRAYDFVGRSEAWKYIYNKTEIEVEISHKDIIWEEACSIERYLISFYGRRDLGLGTLVNMTDGGDGVINPSEETRNKIRAYNIKNNIIPPSRKGKVSTFFGKKHTGDLSRFGKQNIGRTPINKGKKQSEEIKKKISDTLKRKGIKQPSRKGVVYEKIKCEICFQYISMNCIVPHQKSNKCKNSNLKK